jgi:hypothetical protein
MMPGYDASNYNPPAPIAYATLRNPQSGVTVSDVLLIMDSGADITLLPSVAIERLDIPFIAGRHYELMGFEGSKSFAQAAILDMVFLKRVFRGRYLLVEQERGILGRDILNHVALLLDGPRQVWLEHTP